MKAGINKAIKYFGNPYRLAKALGLAQSMTSYWKISGKMSPVLALKCEKKTKGFVRRYELNEDAYPSREFKKLWAVIKEINNYPDQKD